MVKLKGLETSDGRNALVMARINGISLSALVSRLRRGWTVDDAVAQPLAGRCPNQLSNIGGNLMIAEFSLLDGNPITVNMDQIDYIQPAGDNTLIVFSDGQDITVAEPYDAVAEVLNPERQAGN
jgi:uncharacterized protein YlzI (FlbEa/FlbD family)